MGRAEVPGSVGSAGLGGVVPGSAGLGPVALASEVFSAFGLAVVAFLADGFGLAAVVALAVVPAFALGLAAALGFAVVRAFAAAPGFPVIFAVAVDLALVAAAADLVLAAAVLPPAAVFRPAAVVALFARARAVAVGLEGFPLAVAGFAGSGLSTETSGTAFRIADTTEFRALAALVIALVAVAVTVMTADIVLGEDAALVTMCTALLAADEIFAPAGLVSLLVLRALAVVRFGAALAVVRSAAPALAVVRPRRAVAVVRLDPAAAAVVRLGAAAFVVVRLGAAALAVVRLAAAVLAGVLLAVVLFVRPAAVVRPAVAGVTDSVATDLPPMTISYGDIYSTLGDYLHTTLISVVPIALQVSAPKTALTAGSTARLVRGALSGRSGAEPAQARPAPNLTEGAGRASWAGRPAPPGPGRHCRARTPE